MVTLTENILSSSVSRQLLAFKGTAKNIASVSNQLATGKRVNSALDSPNSFFTAFSLGNQASDYNRLLDGIAQSIRTIQQAENGLTAVREFSVQAADTAQETLSEITSLRAERGTVSDLILADEPEMYLRLNDLSGSVAVNSGTAGNPVRGIIQGGTQLDVGNLYFSDSQSETSMFFDGVNDRVRLRNRPELNNDAAGYPEKTIELFFNAEDVNDGRQVLYEQGNTSDGIVIYLDNGSLYVNVTDNGDFGPFNINTKVDSGQTYHVALTFDSPNSTLTTYLDGEIFGTETVTQALSRHSGAGAIGRNQGGTVFHDGAEGGSGEAFRGRISDVASYNKVLSQDSLKARYEASLVKETQEAEAEIQALIDPIDPILTDTSYRGINLLLSDTLRTDFNIDRTSSLKTNGLKLSLEDRGIDNLDFSGPSSLARNVNNIVKLNEDVEDFAASLANDLSIIETRRNFIEEKINTFEAGRDDLTLVNQDEAAAEFLSLETKQAVQVNTLSLSAIQPLSILDLFLGTPA